MVAPDDDDETFADNSTNLDIVLPLSPANLQHHHQQCWPSSAPTKTFFDFHHLEQEGKEDKLTTFPVVEPSQEFQSNTNKLMCLHLQMEHAPFAAIK